MRELTVIGVDCATEGRRVGVALGRWRAGCLYVERAMLCGDAPVARVVGDCISSAGEPALLALDAPLGWPAPLSRTLVGHLAGGPLSAAADQLFQRETDRVVRKLVGKRPLDVGADRIARTAHSTLGWLNELRSRLGPVQMAWSECPTEGVAVIEVYPAATLRAHGIRSNGYKKSGNERERGEILGELRKRLVLSSDAARLQNDGDVLDATVCLLAAKDFLDGMAAMPVDRVLAEKEGWIWVRRADVQAGSK